LSKYIRKDDAEFLHFSGMTKYDNYKLEKKIAQRKYGVREGDWLWIRRRSFIADEMSDYRVKVVFITKHYIAMRYPAGFVECASWDSFRDMIA